MVERFVVYFKVVKERRFFPISSNGVWDVVLQLDLLGEERKRWGEEGERGSR